MPPRSKQPSTEPFGERRRTPRPRVPRAVIKTGADVTAVIVAHDGAEWLPAALAALAESTRTPARVLCVDTGSTDGSAELMEQAYGSVLRLPRTTGYGEAVAAALAAVSATAASDTWLWLLHDDVAVEPTTLAALLDHAETSPSAALLGPKVRDWHDARYLVEVGVTTDAAGHRETGLEHREYDQGQHDAVRDVLAVGTAGALIRRSVWDAVGGLDVHLPVFRDDLDLGWKVNAAGHRVVVVPTARVRHVRASTTGRRTTGASPGRASGVDRRHALWVLLAHASFWRLLGLVPRLVAATILRSVALLVTRDVGAAADEWRALLGVLGRPGVLHRARQARARQRTVSARDLRPLFASRFVRIQSRMNAVVEWFGGGAQTSTSRGALGDPGPEGPDALEDLVAGPSVLRSLLIRPGVQLFVALTVVALIAERSVLAFHGGTLYGGALLPPPGGADDLWGSYGASWHDVSVGTSAGAPPATGALALLSTVLLGKPWLAVDTLLLASVPFAGVSAYLAASRLVRHVYLRVWAAATWALLPVATGAIAAGRLDAAAVQVALPALVLATGRVLTVPPKARGWWRVWGLGLALAATCAFAPLLWPLAVLVLLVGAGVNVWLHGGRSRALAAVLVAVVPGLVLFPWSVRALGQPSLFVVGQQPAEPHLAAWHLPLLSPGGPGLPAVLITVGLLAAALAGTLRIAFRRLALACWGVALLGLAAAGALARLRVSGQPVWPGIPLQVAGLAMLAAALIAGNGVRARLSAMAFSWRQPLAGLVVVAAAATPVLAGVGWMGRGANGPLHRDGHQLLPAFASAELQANPGLRVLSIKARPDGRVAYDVETGGGLGLADAGIRASSGQRVLLDKVVADLVSPRGSDAAEALSTRAIRYVVLAPGGPRDVVVAALDAQVGLVRRTSGDVDLWRVVAPTSRLMIVPPPLATSALAGARAPARDQLRATPPVALAAGPEAATATVRAGPAGRLLVLADAHDRGWRASIDGHRLTSRTAWGWAQAFDLPPGGGHLRLWHTQMTRRAELALEAVLIAGVGVLTVPAGRRRRGLVDDLDEDESDEQEDAEKDDKS